MRDNRLKKVIRQEVQRHLQENRTLSESVEGNLVESILSLRKDMSKIARQGLLDQFQRNAKKVDRDFGRRADRISEDFLDLMDDLYDLGNEAANRRGRR